MFLKFVKTIKDRIVTQIICGDTMEINSKSIIKYDWIILAKKKEEDGGFTYNLLINILKFLFVSWVSLRETERGQWLDASMHVGT